MVLSNWNRLGSAPTQDASYHQDDITFLRSGILNIHLPLWLGGRSKEPAKVFKRKFYTGSKFKVCDYVRWSSEFSTDIKNSLKKTKLPHPRNGPKQFETPQKNWDHIHKHW